MKKQSMLHGLALILMTAGLQQASHTGYHDQRQAELNAYEIKGPQELSRFKAGLDQRQHLEQLKAEEHISMAHHTDWAYGQERPETLFTPEKRTLGQRFSDFFSNLFGKLKSVRKATELHNVRQKQTMAAYNKMLIEEAKKGNTQVSPLVRPKVFDAKTAQQFQELDPATQLRLLNTWLDTQKAEKAGGERATNQEHEQYIAKEINPTIAEDKQELEQKRSKIQQNIKKLTEKFNELTLAPGNEISSAQETLLKSISNSQNKLTQQQIDTLITQYAGQRLSSGNHALNNLIGRIAFDINTAQETLYKNQALAAESLNTGEIAKIKNQARDRKEFNARLDAFQQEINGLLATSGRKLIYNRSKDLFEFHNQQPAATAPGVAAQDFTGQSTGAGSTPVGPASGTTAQALLTDSAQLDHLDTLIAKHSQNPSSPASNTVGAVGQANSWDDLTTLAQTPASSTASAAQQSNALEPEDSWDQPIMITAQPKSIQLANPTSTANNDENFDNLLQRVGNDSFTSNSGW